MTGFKMIEAIPDCMKTIEFYDMHKDKVYIHPMKTNQYFAWDPRLLYSDIDGGNNILNIVGGVTQNYLKQDENGDIKLYTDQKGVATETNGHKLNITQRSGIVGRTFATLFSHEWMIKEKC